MTFKNEFNFEQMQYSISVLYLKYLIYSHHFFSKLHYRKYKRPLLFEWYKILS